jgi:hypothetical protein
LEAIVEIWDEDVTICGFVGAWEADLGGAGAAWASNA